MVAILLAWLAMSTWSWKLWVIIGVGIIVFVRTLYYVTVSRYLRMASLLLAALLVSNVGGTAFQFFAQATEQNFLHFAYESSNPLATLFLTICFVTVVIADVVVKRIEASVDSDTRKKEKLSQQTSSASDGSVSVQNSPGAKVKITVPKDSPSISPDQTGKLIDTVHKQASVIDQLLTQRDFQVKMEFSPSSAQGTDMKYTHIDGNILGDKFQVALMTMQEAGGISSGTFSMPQDRSVISAITEVLQKLETVEDMAAEIREQLSIWNYDVALLISERLEKHLEEIHGSVCPRLLEYLYLIARVHVILAEKNSIISTKHLEIARSYLAQIDTHLSASPNPEIAANVYALRGSIENIVNGPDAALEFLANHDNPYGIRIRLAMHLKKHDPDGAIALIKGLPIHQQWCDLAVTAFVAAGRRDDALALVEWANEQNDRSKYPQCVVRFADASLAHALSIKDQGKNILPHNLSEDERIKVHEVLKDLDPVLSPIIERGSIDSGLAIAAIKIAWQAHHLLGHHDDVRALARLMSTRTPIPTDVARSVMSGYMSPPPDLPKRLREDHPHDLDANILAAVVESHMGEHTKAFEEAKKLLSLADTDEKKEELFKLFRELWQDLDGDAVKECEQIARPLIVHNPNLQAVFDAAQALRNGDGSAALEALDKHKAEDDSYWLQLRGNALMQQGRLEEAVDVFQLAAKKTGMPMLLHKTADLAFQAEKVAVAVECYEQLIMAQPDNLVARGNLASLYTFHLHDISKAAIQFRALYDAKPDNPVHTVNLAICLAQLYKPEESLALYKQACKIDNPDLLRAVLGRADLHLSMGDPDTACTSLQQFRDVLWDSPDFLLACMNTAYAAGEEEFADEAFNKLNELRSAGIVDENAFRLVHTDEALEIFKESIKAAEDRKKLIHTEMAKGRMPWVWAAQISGDAVYWAWRIRTQELDWLGESPVNRSSFTIYSTNGFHARETENGRRALLALECPPLGTPVVIDISALITIHRLGLLNKAADYFGEILVPQMYLETILEDGRKLVIHQRSRQRTAEEIGRHVATGTITMINRQKGVEDSLSVVDEYNDSDTHRYHLTDLMDPVYEAGLLDDLTYQRVSRVFKKSSSVDDKHPALAQLQDILVEILTLETLTSFGLLDTIAKFYRVHIASDSQVELKQRLDTIHFQEGTRRLHFDLWNQIRDDDHFRFVHAKIPREMREKGTSDKDLLAFLASFIAQEKSLPMLADDRSCQAMTLNEREGASHAAFGSDAFIVALSTSGRIDASDAAQAILKLIRWRYRFILPSNSILKTYAAQYRGNPPGLVLQEVAEYVHDCMRDTGLLGGSEKTDLKESIAMKLYLSWVILVSKWLVDVWADSDFKDETAAHLTKWCVQEFLPSLPRVVSGIEKARIGSLTARLMITHVLLAANFIDGGGHLSTAMEEIQTALKLSDNEYLRIVTDILNDIQKREPQS